MGTLSSRKVLKASRIEALETTPRSSKCCPNLARSEDSNCGRDGGAFEPTILIACFRLRGPDVSVTEAFGRSMAGFRSVLADDAL